MAVRCPHGARHNLYVLTSHFFNCHCILTVPVGSYPFQMSDPFVLESSPHIFFTGNQPSFKTAVIEAEAPFRLDGDTEMTDSGKTPTARVRLLSIPKFKETGELILVDTETLEVEVIRFGTFAGKEEEK
jgi:DNA polymerase delta subunit 2